jgi:hypothetical protein
VYAMDKLVGRRPWLSIDDLVRRNWCELYGKVSKHTLREDILA